MMQHRSMRRTRFMSRAILGTGMSIFSISANLFDIAELFDQLNNAPALFRVGVPDSLFIRALRPHRMVAT